MLPSTDKPTKLMEKVERTLSNKKLVPAEKPRGSPPIMCMSLCGVCVCISEQLNIPNVLRKLFDCMCVCVR